MNSWEFDSLRRSGERREWAMGNSLHRCQLCPGQVILVNGAGRADSGAVLP